MKKVMKGHLGLKELQAGPEARQGGREANQQEISNLIGILAAPFVATSTNTAANKRLKELMGL